MPSIACACRILPLACLATNPVLAKAQKSLPGAPTVLGMEIWQIFFYSFCRGMSVPHRIFEVKNDMKIGACSFGMNKTEHIDSSIQTFAEEGMYDYQGGKKTTGFYTRNSRASRGSPANMYSF
jgi:hypothetical protein